MGVKKRWLFVTLGGVLVLSVLTGCAGEKVAPTEAEPSVTAPIPESIPRLPAIPVQEVSMEEAEGIVGVSLTPEYLPAGWKFQRGFVWYYSSPPRANLSLYFSDEEMLGEVKTIQDFDSLPYKIVLNVYQVVKVPSPDIYETMAQESGKVVDINETKGWLSSGGQDLRWRLPGLRFFMYVAVELPEEEILRIAESIG
ncbi:MAG: hypothetical protein JW732_07055 [Dehalococcoidia bacterium]|nr:hypothetical protein [Dehalococcoidia bacterium]